MLFPTARFGGRKHDSQGRAIVGRRQASRVAVREHAGTIGQELCAVPTQFAAGAAVVAFWFVVRFPSLGPRTVGRALVVAAAFIFIPPKDRHDHEV